MGGWTCVFVENEKKRKKNEKLKQTNILREKKWIEEDLTRDIEIEEAKE